MKNISTITKAINKDKVKSFLKNNLSYLPINFNREFPLYLPKNGNIYYILLNKRKTNVTLARINSDKRITWVGCIQLISSDKDELVVIGHLIDNDETFKLNLYNTGKTLGDLL